MSGHAAPLHDPEASFRTDLAAKLSSAQTSLENKLAELRARITTGSDNLAVAQAASQLRGLGDLRQRIERADPSALLTLQSEVAAAVAVTQSFAEQAAAPASQSQQAGQVALYQASEAARRSINDFVRDYYNEEKFDRYLQFTSPTDEEEYRRREQERKRDIDKAMAEQTPEGNLRANQLAIDQLKDAGTHGADRSPDYQPTLDKLERTKHDLSNAIAGPQKKSAIQSAASTLDPSAEQQLPPLGVSPDVIAQLRSARVSAASSPAEACSAPAPVATTGPARCR